MGQPGGALLYGALGATLWESRPGLVSVLGDDYPPRVLEALQQRGVDLSGVHPLGRPGVRTWLLYEGHVRRLIHRLGCPTHRRGLAPGRRSSPPHGAPLEHFISRRCRSTCSAHCWPRSASPRPCVRLDRPSPAGHRGDTPRVAGSPGGRRRVLSRRGRAPARRGADESASGPSSPRQRPPPLRCLQARRERGNPVTTRVTSAFTRGTLAPLAVVDQTGAGDAFCRRAGAGAPRRASDRGLPATRGRHGKLRRRRLGTRGAVCSHSRGCRGPVARVVRQRGQR